MSWSATTRELCSDSSLQGILTKCFEWLQHSETDRSISRAKFLGVQIIIHLTALSESGVEKGLLVKFLEAHVPFHFLQRGGGISYLCQFSNSLGTKGKREAAVTFICLC